MNNIFQQIINIFEIFFNEKLIYIFLFILLLLFILFLLYLFLKLQKISNSIDLLNNNIEFLNNKIIDICVNENNNNNIFKINKEIQYIPKN